MSFTVISILTEIFLCFFHETAVIVHAPGLTKKYHVGFRVTVCISVADRSCFEFVFFNWRLITLQYCGGFAIHSVHIREEARNIAARRLSTPSLQSVHSLMWLWRNWL